MACRKAAYRGSGIGGRLFVEACNQYRSMGCHKIKLTAPTRDAVCFMEHQGWLSKDIIPSTGGISISGRWGNVCSLIGKQKIHVQEEFIMAWKKLGMIFDLKQHNIGWLKSHAMLPSPLVLDDRIRASILPEGDGNGHSRISFSWI
jgi:hypothetical protein